MGEQTFKFKKSQNTNMTFQFDKETTERILQLRKFMIKHLYPIEKEYREFIDSSPRHIFPRMDELKQKAKNAGLWNLFLPHEYGEFSPGLTNLQYAPLAQEMGKITWASEVFNCSAPDTGNMEVLAKYGTKEQQDKWLAPLLEGKIRSAFLMTEPQVASSDARNIETHIKKEGNEYVINGRKWWSSNAYHPNIDCFILLGKTDPDGPPHSQQSMIIIPPKTEGVKMVRSLPVFNDHHFPGAHAEIDLVNVRVPESNLILGEGRGFEIAQGRLGPGRIHHCMRLIGMAERSLQYMCKRVKERETFGKKLSSYSSIRQDIAKSACEIEQARLLTLSAADTIDRKGIKEAKGLISMIKIVAPQMVCNVVDRAMQVFGGKAMTNDIPLVDYYSVARLLRFADGPDEVHMYQLGRNIIKYTDTDTIMTQYLDEVG